MDPVVERFPAASLHGVWDRQLGGAAPNPLRTSNSRPFPDGPVSTVRRQPWTEALPETPGVRFGIPVRGRGRLEPNAPRRTRSLMERAAGDLGGSEHDRRRRLTPGRSTIARQPGPRGTSTRLAAPSETRNLCAAVHSRETDTTCVRRLRKPERDPTGFGRSSVDYPAGHKPVKVVAKSAKNRLRRASADFAWPALAMCQGR